MKYENVTFLDFKSGQSYHHSPIVECDCCKQPIVMFRDNYTYAQDGGIICKACVEIAVDLNLKVSIE